MSHTLLTADNISVKGYRYEAEEVQSIPLETVSAPHISNWVGTGLEKYKDQITKKDAIHFDFTILINGKLKTFGWSFIVVPDEISKDEFTFEQWSDWNAIYFVLENLGYGFTENKYSFGQSEARRWINQIMR